MKCGICGEEVKNYISHMWKEHREEQLRRNRENIGKAHNARRKSKVPKLQPEPPPGPEHKQPKEVKEPLAATTHTAYQSKFEYQMTPKMVAGYEVVLSKRKDLEFSHFIDMLIDDVFEARGLNVFEEQANVRNG